MGWSPNGRDTEDWRGAQHDQPGPAKRDAPMFYDQALPQRRHEIRRMTIAGGTNMAPRTRSATKWRDQTIINLLDKLARERELDSVESILMERTVRRLTPPREIWRWKQTEDQQIIDLIKRRKRLGRPKPFQKNDEIRLLAEKLGRTPWAVYRRMERLRKKCSDAQSRRKG